MTVSGAAPDAIREAERQLHVSLPEDYREWLMTVNGEEGWYGRTFIQLHSLDVVLAMTLAAEADQRLPGFVAIGSDGSRELLAFDLRREPAPVLLVDATAENWDAGILQATSFAELLVRRDRGELLVWE